MRKRNKMLNIEEAAREGPLLNVTECSWSWVAELNDQGRNFYASEEE